MDDPKYWRFFFQFQILLPKLGFAINTLCEFASVFTALIKQTAIYEWFQNMRVKPAGTWVKIIGLVLRTIEGIGEVLTAGTMGSFDVQDVQPHIPFPKHPVMLPHHQTMRILEQHVLGKPVKSLETIPKQGLASFAQ